VLRDGIQRKGGRERQRWRCVLEDGTFHRFIGPLGRTRTDEPFCETCDNPIAPSEGPASMWRSEFLVREVAATLVAVGRGATYTDAARRVRGSARPYAGTRRKPSTVESGQTVANWLADFGPAVIDRRAEEEWPECLVLDSTEFIYTDPRTGVRSQLFAILAAWGYTDDGQARLWKLAASPRDDGPAWQAFLASLPGRPRSVVCDRDYAIVGAVQQHWGKGATGVPIHLCEHHLYAKGREALRRDGAHRFGHDLGTLLAEAFATPEGWAAFASAADPATYPHTAKWARHWDARMRRQTARRHTLPAHYATGAVEDAIATVRQHIERRAWCFRNLARMNLLLGLMRLAINHHDDTSRYAAAIKAHLLLHGGQPPHRHKTLYDATVGGSRVSTLRR
jgi:hypothetical protein